LRDKQPISVDHRLQRRTFTWPDGSGFSRRRDSESKSRTKGKGTLARPRGLRSEEKSYRFFFAAFFAGFFAAFFLVAMLSILPFHLRWMIAT